MRAWLGIFGFCLTLTAGQASGQWTNHYHKVESFGHHVYLEQENLPILSSGPVYPAASPDGTAIAFAHQGWIWLLDLKSGDAHRLTNSSAVDSRPRWSPDSGKLAFVRDSGSDTAIMVVRRDGKPAFTIDTPAIELDPEFARDGKSLFYTSARMGHLDLWRRNLTTGGDEQLTINAKAARSVRELADGRLVYQDQIGQGRKLVMRAGDSSPGSVLFEQGWMAHLNPDVHPTERSIVYGVGEGNMVRLAVMDVDQPAYPRWLTPTGEKALFPAWSADGSQIYYVMADAHQQFTLQVVGAAGGKSQAVLIKNWDFGAKLGELTIETRNKAVASTPRGAVNAIPARLSVTRSDGHPIANPFGSTFVDNQNGPVYFYTSGHTKLTLAEGEYRIVATHGPFSLPQSQTVRVEAGHSSAAILAISEIWNAHDAGFMSADHHVHLNGSGVNELALRDLLLPMQGEALDFSAPMAWNQYNRFIDAERVGQEEIAADGTTARLSQEVRSDFHGHIGLIGASQAFQPWFFGPTVPVYGNRNLHNGLVNPFAKAQGALATYVHPVSGDSDPFLDPSTNELPYELVVDGVLSDGIGLELVCQWTNALRAAETWYRFLNIGKPMPATAGTDMMANFYRLPAIGTARAYVPASGGSDPYMAAVDQVRQGRGFVTTGPALLFAVAGQRPGDVVRAGKQEWSIDLASVRPVERVEIVVNGKVVESLKGFAGKGRTKYRGSVVLPAGGWVAARAVGGATGWPIMSYAQFAHTQPVWIDHVGSTDQIAARAAATDLLKILIYSQGKFSESYGSKVPPGLSARLNQAGQDLRKIMER